MPKYWGCQVNPSLVGSAQLHTKAALQENEASNYAIILIVAL